MSVSTNVCGRTIPAGPYALAQRRRTLGDAEVARFRPLVGRLAGSLRHRLPSGITYEDLVSAGWVGLVECWGRYVDIVPEDEFEDFAACRVRGAMIDHLRTMQPGARVARSAGRRIDRAMKLLESKLGRTPTDVERADVTRKEHAKSPSPRHEDVTQAYDLAASTPSPEDAVATELAIAALRRAIASLPARLQTVLALIHTEERSHPEIAAILGVSPSRVSQLHGQAIAKLREALVVQRESAEGSEMATTVVH